MASGLHGVWAIDVGNNSLKALRLRSNGGNIEIIGFDYIEHSKLLAGDKSVCKEEADQIMADTLHQFVERNDVSKDEVAIAMAGQNSFARFIKLPPVEPKGIPKIVQYEAVQQIPFDINEVEWDWQLMTSSDSAEAEVGIFAIKNELINDKMSVFAKESLKVSCIQVSPMALYNYLTYDQKDFMDADDKPVVVIDVGAENTTLVVCSKTAVWQRTIRIGGNTFTEAIADAFKLRFRKAERLKRTAPMSKYVRQLFSAMKPVFTDLGSEIQRSLGFYSSSHQGHGGFSKVVALGGGMKLQGLAKYLQKNLGVPVIKPDSFEKPEISSELSAAKFHENVSDFATAYGLGIQMLDEAKIDINLLPRKLATAMMWARKGRNFTIAACAMLAFAILSFASAKYAYGKYNSNESVAARKSVESVIGKARSASSKLNKEKKREATYNSAINKQTKLFRYRDVIPMLLESVTACLPNAINNPEQAELYAAFEAGDVGKVQTWPRNERKQVFVTSTLVSYTDSLLNAKFEKMKKRKEKRKVGPSMEEMMMMMGGGRMGGPMGGMGGPMGGMGGPMGGFGPGGSGDFMLPRARLIDPGKNDAAGFVVILEGYCPYKDIPALMDPAGVANDKSRWGFVTRLGKLSKKGFEIFEKEKTAHFQLKIIPIDLRDNKDMPIGIGNEETVDRVPQNDDKKFSTISNYYNKNKGNRIETEKVLLDPMTGEEMSMTYDIITQEEIDNAPDLADKDLGLKKLDEYDNEKFIERDCWFRLSIKIKWAGAPLNQIKDDKTTTVKTSKKSKRSSASRSKKN